MSEQDRAKWDARHAAAEDDPPRPAWLDAFDAAIPRAGRALDVAAGRGRIARWLADRGLDVTAVDISAAGLARIAHPRVTTVVHDLQAEPSLPPGPFDVVAIFFYRQPGLAQPLRDALAPGGLLLAEHPTITNLERNARPSRRWLAAPGELRELAVGLEVIHHDEAWRDGTHTARLVARRPG